jgi:hypothetical protein
MRAGYQFALQRGIDRLQRVGLRLAADGVFAVLLLGAVTGLEP